MSAAPRLAVFDCDGTLVDGQAGVCDAMAQAFAAQHLPAPDPRAVRRSVGLSLGQAITTLMPGVEPMLLAALVDSYKQAFRAARERGDLVEPLFDGLHGVLDGARARGWLLGVATGKSRRGLDHCLAGHGLTQHFATLQTADHHPSKPHPAMLAAALEEAMVAPQDAVMIGDTVYDMSMAAALGVRAIGVAWGYHEAAELRRAGAQAVAATPEHLLELLP